MSSSLLPVKQANQQAQLALAKPGVKSEAVVEALSEHLLCVTQCEGVGMVGSGAGFLDSNPGSDRSRRTVVPVHMHEGDIRCYTLAAWRVLCWALARGCEHGRAGREACAQVCGSHLEVSVLWAQQRLLSPLCRGFALRPLELASSSSALSLLQGE